MNLYSFFINKKNKKNKTNTKMGMEKILKSIYDNELSIITLKFMLGDNWGKNNKIIKNSIKHIKSYNAKIIFFVSSQTKTLLSNIQQKIKN